MYTQVNNDARSERILRQSLTRHNESKLNSLNCHERLVAKTMINFPPTCDRRRLHGDEVGNRKLSSTITDSFLLEENTDPGQQLFDQLIQRGRKRDRLLVPDLATEWFRKQKIFLDKISPEKIQSDSPGAAEPMLMEQLLSNCQKFNFLPPTEQRFTRQNELKKRKLCQQYSQNRCICCTRVTTNNVQPLRKRCLSLLSSKAEEAHLPKDQQEQMEEEKSVARNPITICKPYVSSCGATTETPLPSERLDNISLSKKNKRMDGGVTCLKLPLRRRCACRQTWRKRNSYSCMFQADGQPMSGDCLTARRTEPLLPRLRMKYDLRKAPQRRLDPKHFRRISPEFYSLLKRYEDGMTQRYPLYGISMRHWSETKPYCPCEMRAKHLDHQYLGDEALKSLPDKPKTQLTFASLEYTSNKNLNPTKCDGGDSSSEQVPTAAIESSTEIQVPCTTKTCPTLNHVPCTTKTCPALYHEPPIFNNCQYCNTCTLQPMKSNNNKTSSEKNNSGCCRPHQPSETEVNSKDSRFDKVTTNNKTTTNTSQGIPHLTACCSIPRCVASSVPTIETAMPQHNLPHYQSFSSTQRKSTSPISTFLDGTCTEHSTPMDSRNRHTSLLGDVVCLCKRALLPGRHLLYNFSNKYRHHREEYGDKQTGKPPLLTKRNLKQPHQRSQDIHNAPPCLFETHPAPCCWHLRNGPHSSNSSTTLKANHSSLNVVHSFCEMRDSQKSKCICTCAKICESPGRVSIHDGTEKKSRMELANISIPSSNDIVKNLKVLEQNQKCNIFRDSVYPNPSITGECCEPPLYGSQKEVTNRIVSCTNDKYIQSNLEETVKKKLLNCDCSLLTDAKPKKKKKLSVDPKGACPSRKFPCTRACFLASDYLQLMRRVARKRTNIMSPKRKSLRSNDNNREPSPLQNTQNIVLVPQSNPKSSNTRNCKTKICQSRKPSPQWREQQKQKKSNTGKFLNSETSNPGNYKACYGLSKSENEEPNCNRFVKDRKRKLAFNKNGSSDSSPDIHCSVSYNSHRSKAVQNPNNVPSKLTTKFAKSHHCPFYRTAQSRSSDSHSSNRLQLQNTVDYTILSCKRKGPFKSCCCKRRSISSRTQPCYLSNQQKYNLHCTSSLSTSFSHSSSSGSEKDGNQTSVWLLTVPKKNSTLGVREHIGETNCNNNGIGNLSKTTKIKHGQCANTLQPSWSNSANQNKVPSKFLNETWDLEMTSSIQSIHPFIQSTSSPFESSESQRCYLKETHHVKTQMKASEIKKRTRFAVSRLGHSSSSTHASSSNTSSINWPRVPDPSVASMTSHTLDMGHKISPVLKNNQSSADSINFPNGRCKPVICYLGKTESTREHKQELYSEASAQLPTHSSQAKLFGHNSTINKELTRQSTPLAKTSNHRYNHNHAQLLLFTKRPPPSQLRTCATHFRQQQNWSLKKRPIWQSPHILKFDEQYKKVQNKDAYLTGKQCYDIINKKKDYKSLTITQRANSGCDVRLQKDDREPLDFGNNEHRLYQCNYRDSIMSVIGNPHIKQKVTISTGSGCFNFKPSSKYLGIDTGKVCCKNLLEEDSLSQNTHIQSVNDKTYLEDSERSNVKRDRKFIFNVETPSSQNARQISSTKSTLLSQFAKPTLECNRKCLGNASIVAPSRKRNINRNFLQPATTVADLDYYTYSSKRMQPFVQSVPRQNDCNTDIYIKPPSSPDTSMDNLRSENISVFPFPTIPVNLSLKRKQNGARRRYYSSSSDSDDNRKRGFRHIRETSGYSALQ